MTRIRALDPDLPCGTGCELDQDHLVPTGSLTEPGSGRYDLMAESFLCRPRNRKLFR